MKQRPYLQKCLMLATLMLACVLSAAAYDFEVDGIYYNKNGENATVTYSSTSYNSYSGDVVIPEIVSYNDTSYTVTAISIAAFKNSTGLTSVEIPSSVTSMGYDVFNGCTALTTVNIPIGLKTISQRAFRSCTSLTSITIPETVTKIIQDAFRGCTSLTAIVIPDSVSSLGANVFAGCTSLQNVVIGNGLTTISSACFEGCTALSQINIHNQIQTIGENAFNGCTSLISITIPQSVTSIGSGAFGGCTALTEFVVAEGNEKYTTLNGVLFNTALTTLIAYPAGCENTSYEVPASVTTIGNGAFKGCQNLNQIVLPDSLTTMQANAFYNCTALTSINIPDDITIIADYLFYKCSSLKEMTLPNSITRIGNYAFYSCSSLDSLKLSENLKSIYDYAFYSCKSLTEVHFPETLTYIGEDAFSYCSNLKSLTIPGSVKTIDWNAFEGSGITFLTLCEGIETIKYSAFSGCPIKHVTLPNSLVTLGGGVFWCCRELESVTFNKGLKEIGHDCFEGCNLLTKVVIPDSVSAVEYDAFNSCPNLNSVTIGRGVTSVASRGFGGSSNLKAVFCRALTPPTMKNSDSFTDAAYSKATLYVHKPSLEAYQTTDYWKNFNNIVGTYFDYLTFDKQKTLFDETIILPVKLENYDSISGFQTDIYLADGLSFVQENGTYLLEGSSRLSDNHLLTGELQDDGALRVTCTSSPATIISGEEGELFYVTIYVGAECMGDYALEFKNTTFTSLDDSEAFAADSTAGSITVTYLLGDANLSKTVTVADAVSTILYLLERKPSPFYFLAADVNLDEAISVTDAALISYMALNGETSLPKRIARHSDGCDQMSADDICLSNRETQTVTINLNNDNMITAFQLDLDLPQGLEASNFCLSNRASKHQLASNVLSNGKTRVVCYSPNLETIADNEGAVLEFDVTANGTTSGNIVASNIEAVTDNCETLLLDNFSIGVNVATAINEIADSEWRIYVDGHDIVIESTVDQSLVISDVAGHARNINVQAGITRIAVDAGIYLIHNDGNTQKLIIK